jgi:hypothetical protein
VHCAGRGVPRSQPVAPTEVIDCAEVAPRSGDRFGEIESPEHAAAKDDALVHVGECEQQWSSSGDGEKDG